MIDNSVKKYQLISFCKKNGLRIDGKKESLLNRVNVFLETGIIEQSSSSKRRTISKNIYYYK
ncbi:hypothetical protein [uncultured Psychroserpens sp.]|uniref:SAP domain-containing protein n=1 Tax=uncultured Psychroserpens sp. TaxID=255436 RepID=UPI003456EAB3